MQAPSVAATMAAIPYRIRIGVAGHRSLPDEAAVRAAVREIVDRRIYDLFDQESKERLEAAVHTPVRLSVVTALAEGADHVVTEEILRTPEAVLTAVLPLEAAEYLETISATAKGKFRELAALDRRPECLRRLALRQEFPQYSKEAIDNARKAAYDAAGRHVVDHCDVLIAVWDGNPARGRGGTAEVVEYARRRKRPVAIIPPSHPAAIEIVAGYGLNARAVTGIEAFNCLRLNPGTESEYRRKASAAALERAGAEGIPETTKKIIREGLIPYYVRASSMAKRSQGFYHWAGRLGYGLSALAVALVGFGVLFPEYARLAFGLEFLCLGLVIAIVTWTHHRRSHQVWIESRFLAERLRSAFFLAGCGMEASKVEVPPYFGPAHQTDDWMVRVFEEIWLRLPPLARPSEPACDACRRFVQEGWLKIQADFHRNTAAAAARLTKWTERVSLAVFLMALAAAGGHFFLGDLLAHRFHPGHVGLTLLAIALPGVGSALAGIRSHREYARLEKRSRHMATVLDDLRDRLAKVGDPAEFASLVREAEDLMLRETQEWLMLMRFTKLEAV